MKKLLILISFILFCFYGYSQHSKEKIKLKELNITNNKFDSIIKNIIENERKCDYYNCKLTFAITINALVENPDDLTILIESFDNKNNALALKPFGYFYIDNHLFLVDGSDTLSLLNSSNEYKEFDYIVYDPAYQDPENENFVVYFFTDDSYSLYEYFFQKDAFILKNKTSSCEKQ